MSLNGFFFKQLKISNAVEIDKYNFLYKHHKADMNGRIFLLLNMIQLFEFWV